MVRIAASSFAAGWAPRAWFQQETFHTSWRMPWLVLQGRSLQAQGVCRKGHKMVWKPVRRAGRAAESWGSRKQGQLRGRTAVGGGFVPHGGSCECLYLPRERRRSLQENLGMG